MSDAAAGPAPNSAVTPTDQRLATSILVVDDEPGMRSFLQRALSKHYTLVEVARTTEEAEALRQRCHFDLLLVDIRLSDRSGVEWLQELRAQGVTTDVIFMTAYADLETAVDALRAGATDFILKPFRMDQMLAAVRRCLGREQLRRENFVLKRQVEQVYSVEGLIGDCGSLKEICQLVQRVAPTPSTILIEGESGTGKELVARAIHRMSGRTGAFVPVNCAAISEELFESELFGHTKGAFTGASQAREGLFSYAHGGTLFLDEIGEMPSSIQTKLLRVLEQRTIRPVGTNREVPVDARIVAATNRELQSEVNTGRFREDLFYRLHVVAFRMPSLRDRPEDIGELARHFLASLSAELGVPSVELREQEIQRLQAYDWPGNVRELKNLMERAVLLGESPARLLPAGADTSEVTDAGGGYGAELKLEDVERLHILRVLEAADGNKSEAARRLGVARKTLERKLRAYEGSPLGG